MDNPTSAASVARDRIDALADPLDNSPGSSDTHPAQNPAIRSKAAAPARTVDALEADLGQICARFQALALSAAPEMCVRPSSTGSWSAAECIRHLNLSSDAYFPIWQRVIATAGPRKSELNAPYRLDFWGRFLCWILEPPPRIRSKTPAPFEPVACGEVAEVLDGFVERQQRIIAALRRCRGRAVDQVKMASPLDARVRYSIWSSFVLTAAHQRRHLWQAERAIQMIRAAR